MSGFAARDLPALGWDPCPGDVVGARSLAADLRALAARLGEAGEQARADAPSWRGSAADRHRWRVEALPVSLRLVAASAAALAAEVEGWADELTLWQARADDLERRAREAAQHPPSPGHVLTTATGLTRRDDALRGLPPGSSALGAVRTMREEDWPSVVQADARRLHEDYTDASRARARAVGTAVDQGLRAPWSGLPPGGGAADGGLPEPDRAPALTLWRHLTDGHGRWVHEHAADLDGTADGLAGVAVVGAVPLPPTEAVGAAAAVGSAVAVAQLELVVDDDPVAAAVGVGGAVLPLLPGRLGRSRSSSAGTGTSVERSQQAVEGAVPVDPVPDAWDVPGFVGTARRTEREGRGRARAEAEAEEDRRRAADVQRCTGG